MGKRISTTEARKDFTNVVKKAAERKRRIVLTRQGEEVAAVIPIEDLRRLEELEDRLDNEAADRALAEAKASGEPNVPWEQIKHELDL